MTRVLLTGASGFVGSNVLGYMLEHTDWDFVSISSWRHRGSPLRLQQYADDPRVEIITHDLASPMPDIGDFDYIFNLASESHVDRSIADPVPFVLNNIQVVLELLEYARKHKPKLFIQFSTDEVFGHTDVISDVLWPSNPYAASKAAQEVILSAYRKTYGIQAVVTNSNNIIGPNQDPEKFVARIVGQISRGETVKVHVGKNGYGKRVYNPVENVAAALQFLAEHYQPVAQDAPTPRYGLVGGTQMDNLEMAKLVASVMGKELKYEEVDVFTIRPGYDEQYPGMNDELTKLGFVPPLTLEQGLEWTKSA